MDKFLKMPLYELDDWLGSISDLLEMKNKK